MKSRKSRKPEKTEKKLSFQSVALGCTVLAAVLAGAWVLFPKEMERMINQLPKVVGLHPDAAAEPEDLPLLEQAGGNKQNAAENPARADAVSVQGLPKVNLPTVTAQTEQSSPAEAAKPAAQPISCTQAAGSLRNFLEDIDKKSYIQDFKLKQPVRKHLDGLKEKLAAKPPAVVRETDDLYTVISNTAHFFRVIGKDNIQLIKTLLEQEKGNLEEAAAVLHAASIGPDCPADTVQLPFSTAYDYSVFFLNTIGGRSYLFRREAKVRLLINYYALLLIDEANIRGANTHGTDIRGMIQPLLREIEDSSQLVRKDQYIAKLRELAERYPAK